MPEQVKQEPATETSDTPRKADTDAPSRPSMRECSDRIAKMERELLELRDRFANVHARQTGASARN